MRRVILGLLVLTASAAKAEDVTDVYKTVTRQIPTTTRVCEMVNVPVYQQGPMNTEGAIVGGVVGGLLGSAVGKGDGKKAAIGAGAIAGAVLGGKSEQPNGYRQEERCRDQVSYTATSEQVYDHSVVSFNYGGRKYSVNFQK